jgi:hypothetical protein
MFITHHTSTQGKGDLLRELEAVQTILVCHLILISHNSTFSAFYYLTELSYQISYIIDCVLSLRL